MFRTAVLKKLFIIFSLLGFIVAVGLGYLSYVLPQVGDPPEIKVARTKDQIERGKYLALNVMACLDCHSTKHWNKFAAPIDTNNLGGGGQIFDQKDGIPGKFPATNLTSFHLGDWTDGEIYRAITAGVSKDGRALFPIMPYLSYGQMDKEDIYAVIAYLRTLPEVASTVPDAVADFPMNFIINTLPQKAVSKKAPSPKDTIAYGAYLVLAADCRSCHTNNDGEAFSGGRAFKMNGATAYSTNITSDKNTGIGTWSKEQFIARFKVYETIKNELPVDKGDFQTPMPWLQFSKMKDDDLASIYAYLQSLKAVNNKVLKFKRE